MMNIIQGGFAFAVSLYLTLVAIGASVKTVQWLGQKLKVKQLEIG